MTPALDGQIGPSQPFKGPFEGVEAHDLAGSQGFLVGDWTPNYQGTRGGVVGLFLGFRVGFRA